MLFIRKLTASLALLSLLGTKVEGRLRSKDKQRTLQTCEDYPGWEDVEDFDCAWYAEEEDNCEWAEILDNEGEPTAFEACCACGGGTMVPEPTPVPPPVVPPTPVAPPTATPVVPTPSPHCPPATPQVTQFETEVLTLVNQIRSQGYTCGSRGTFPPAGPLQMDPNLQCAARFHSKWLADNNTFSHSSPGGALGDSASERAQNSGFQGQYTGENVAGGSPTPEAVMQNWLGSDGHCAGIMNSGSNVIGIGYHYVDRNWRHYATQVFGRVNTQ